jgi:nucleotide-binding universal stress UspA family protein
VFETIMVATDGSHSAAKAVHFAAEFAKRHGSRLVICTVTSQHLATIAEEPGGVPVTKKTGVPDAATQFALEVLRRAEQEVKAAGIVNYELCEAFGTNLGATIAQQAEAHGADHVVVGSIGGTGLGRLLLGSVAASVVRHAHCPVTVVR